MKTSRIILSILLIGLIITSIAFKPAKQPTQPTIKYTLTLTDQQWNSILFPINNPDDVSVNQRKQITSLIQQNLVADTTKK